MPVECPGTALGTAIAGESDHLNNIREEIFWIPFNGPAFLVGMRDQSSKGFWIGAPHVCRNVFRFRDIKKNGTITLFFMPLSAGIFYFE